MARTKRNEMLRHHAQAVNHMDKYIMELRWLGDQYAEHHPNHVTMCLKMVEAAENLKGFTQQFKNEMM